MNKTEIGSILIPLIVGLIGIVTLVMVSWYLSNRTLRENQAGGTRVSQAEQEKGVLRVAENIDESGFEADQKEFYPMIDYLVNKFQGNAIRKGQFIGTHSTAEMAELMREGKIDIVIDSPFPVFVVNKLAGATPLAIRWKNGVEKYHSAIFVKADSPIKTIDDLKGKIIALDRPTSTAGYFLPKSVLVKQGYTLTQKNSPTDSVSANEIGYIFVGSHIYDDVTSGLTSAGAENDVEIRGHFGATFSQYRYIAITPDIPRSLVAVSPDMNQSMRNTLKNILLTMDTSPQGQQVLKSFGTAKFTSIDNTDAAYGVIKDLTDLVEAEIVKQ